MNSKAKQWKIMIISRKNCGVPPQRQNKSNQGFEDDSLL
jgi:hypothetical protein